ncbi:beta-lactamase family protein [Streptomyces spectabilis]|uniref:beta-lactamase family protein n=1 Tax=Streptomyces spectabilis TaxID=68270 RepID=UPI001CEF63F2|nr:beta-lactamase family protein [Streptomyces spectabilis]
MFRIPTLIVGSDTALSAAHGHDADRHVQIGSLTKVVTGTARARMAEAGVLDRDDALERWLPGAPATGITLCSLADHTSGPPRLPPDTRRLDPYRSKKEYANLGQGDLAQRCDT